MSKSPCHDCPSTDREKCCIDCIKLAEYRKEIGIDLGTFGICVLGDAGSYGWWSN